MPITEELACREFVELVTDYLEEALPAPVRESFEAHIKVCSGCQLYLGQMRLVVRAMHQPHGGVLATEVAQRIIGHFRAWRSSDTT